MIVSRHPSSRDRCRARNARPAPGPGGGSGWGLMTAIFVTLLASPSVASAQAPPSATSEAQLTPEQIHLEGTADTTAPASTLPEAPPEAPPPLPRKKGFVLEGEM